MVVVVVVVVVVVMGCGRSSSGSIGRSLSNAALLGIPINAVDAVCICSLIVAY